MSEDNGVPPFNRQFVGRRGDTVTVAAPQAVMTRREALEQAAWLVAVAQGSDDSEFQRILDWVRNI